MTNSVIRFAILAMSLAPLAAPRVPALAAGGGGGGGRRWRRPLCFPYESPAPSQGTKATRSTHRAKKKPDKQSLFDDPAFAKDYRAAYATI